MDERGIPRQGYDILNNQGDKIGKVTSGTMSPTLAKGIGMGYIPTNLKSCFFTKHLPRNNIRVMF